MQTTVRNEIWDSLKSKRFDVIMVNPGMRLILRAFEKIKPGEKVLVLFDEDIDRNGFWTYTYLFPNGLNDIFPKWRLQKNLKKWSRLAPHLFRPVKTLYVGRKKPVWMMKIIDAVHGNDFQKQSAKIKLTDFPFMTQPVDNFDFGWSFQEYRINIGRLKIELLKEFFKQGGWVLNYTVSEIKGGKISITDKLTNHRTDIENTKIIHGKQLTEQVFGYNTTPPWEGFSLRVNKPHNSLLLFDNSGKIAVKSGKNVDLNQLKEIMKPFSNIVDENPVQTSRETENIGEVFRKFPSFLENIELNCAPKSKKGRIVEDLLETSFDLAKQTGIGFQDFSKLYLRYGENIHWMIERAYEWMSETRDANKIWMHVEKEFVSGFEWSVAPEIANLNET